MKNAPTLFGIFRGNCSSRIAFFCSCAEGQMKLQKSKNILENHFASLLGLSPFHGRAVGSFFGANFASELCKRPGVWKTDAGQNAIWQMRGKMQLRGHHVWHNCFHYANQLILPPATVEPLCAKERNYHLIRLGHGFLWRQKTVSPLQCSSESLERHNFILRPSQVLLPGTSRNCIQTVEARTRRCEFLPDSLCKMNESKLAIVESFVTWEEEPKVLASETTIQRSRPFAEEVREKRVLRTQV